MGEVRWAVNEAADVVGGVFDRGLRALVSQRGSQQYTQALLLVQLPVKAIPKSIEV